MNRLTSTLLLVSCLGLTSAFLVACGGGAPIRPHFIEGVDAHDNGDLHGAIAAYEAALDEVPDDYKVHYNLALIYHELYEAALRAKDDETASSRHQEAQSHYNAVLALRPKSLPAVLGLAELSADSGDIASASAQLAGVQGASETEQMHLWLAQAQLAALAGDIKSQREFIVEVLKVDTAASGAASAMAELQLADGDMDRAAKTLAPALEVHPHNLSLLAISAAIALQRAVQLETGPEPASEAWIAADLAYRRILTLNPRDYRALLGLSRCLEGRGDIGGAIDSLWRARRNASNRALLNDGEEPQLWHQAVQKRLLSLYKRVAEWEAGLTLPSAGRLQSNP